MEGAYDLTKINVRLFIAPFQQYIAGNPGFVHNILQMNTAYFIGYDFEKMLAEEQLLDEYSKKLIHKFREATIARQDDTKTVHAIFNWFKVMMYYAFLDQGKDPKAEMARVSAAVGGGAWGGGVNYPILFCKYFKILCTQCRFPLFGIGFKVVDFLTCRGYCKTVFGVCISI